MKMKKNLMMMLAACLALSVPLSGCGSTVKDTSSSVSSEVSGEAETSGKSSQELLDEENAIMAKNNDLWEKVFASMSKNVTEDTLSSNYGDDAGGGNFKNKVDVHRGHSLPQQNGGQCAETAPQPRP